MKNKLIFVLILFISNFAFSTIFKDCLKAGLGEIQCYQANEGFSDCINDKQPTSLCLTAKKGYQDCRNDKLQPSMCMNVNGNYKECREKKEPHFCASVTSN